MFHADIFQSFLQCLGLVAVIAIAYGFILDFADASLRNTAVGFAFAFGAVTSMAFPTLLAGGLSFDLRHVFLVLVTAYGGIVSLMITALATIAFRVWSGGVGMMAGLAGIAISGLVGLAAARTLRERSPMSLTKFALLCLGSVSSLLGLFLLPSETARVVLDTVALPLTIANLIGLVVASAILDIRRGQTLKSKYLETEANTDPLTGLPNRRAFQLQASRLVRTVRDNGQACTLMFIDIDHFKKINDTFGHAAGDHVLRSVANVLASQARSGDLLARYGGEEFVIVSLGADAKAATRIGERIRNAVHSASIEAGGARLMLTVSVGYFVMTDPDGTLREALERADQALYWAKEAGRNRVEEWVPIEQFSGKNAAAANKSGMDAMRA